VIDANTENNIVLNNSISNGFKLFTTIKKRNIVNLSCGQASKRTSKWG